MATLTNILDPNDIDHLRRSAGTGSLNIVKRALDLYIIALGQEALNGLDTEQYLKLQGKYEVLKELLELLTGEIPNGH